MDKVYFIINGSMHILYILFMITLLLSCFNFISIISIKNTIFSDNFNKIKEHYTNEELKSELNAMKLTNTCNNKSLNKLHESGSIEKKIYDIGCNQKSDNMNFYQKYKPYEQIYTADDIHAIQGSNYMNFQKNPNPYILGYKLYDKDEKVGNPVGMNYNI